MKNNPDVALDALLETDTLPDGECLHPITIARYALLELVDSPLAGGKTVTELAELIPTFYILAQPTEKLKGYSSRNKEKLKADAMEWADTIEDLPWIDKLLKEAVEKIKALNKASPPSDQPKKA